MSTEIPQGWADLTFFNTDWPAIQAAIDADPRTILPPAHQRFAALEHTPPEKTRVVILGQDPYHTPGKADGLAFSIPTDFPGRLASLGNILKELNSDLGVTRQQTDLRDWADKGVLLLNTALTVPTGEANGHKALGWDKLVHQVLARTSQRPTAYILWGNQAQKLATHINPGDHLILKTAHPSPLSARRGFFGSRPFSAVNDWLRARGEEQIDWTA
ncbi:uracil-DNA glycosylase [Rhodobacteraceae bacterium M382]|nr:uracil-DNA glycosylase [Rhodobacteraceae bacterium M382]